MREMQYPKPIMTIQELKELGFTDGYLRQMAHRRGQKYATRQSQSKKSTILFDTEKFEKERQKMLTR